MGADIAASVSESPPREIASLRQSTKSFDSRKLRSAAGTLPWQDASKYYPGFISEYDFPLQSG